MVNAMSFENWMNAVNNRLLNLTGLTADDFPDHLWADEYEDSTQDAESAKIAADDFLDLMGVLND